MSALSRLGVRNVGEGVGIAFDSLRARCRPPNVVGGDAARIPLADRSVDAAWLSTVIHHVPDLTAAARELRDRWLEQVNSGPMALPAGKYDVSRGQIPSNETPRNARPVALIEAA